MLIDKGNGKYYNGTDEVSTPCIILINYDTRIPDDGKHGPANCYISGNTTMGAKNGYEILDITKWNNVARRNICVDTTNVKKIGQPDTTYHVYHFKVPVNLDQLSIPDDKYLRENCLYYSNGHVYFKPHGQEAILLG